MYAINFVGSSHLSRRHGFPQTVHRHLSQTDYNFKSKFSISEIKSCPGATYCHDKFLSSFVNIIHDQRKEEKYVGQVNVIVMGSNDQREISSLPSDQISGAILKFRSKMMNFVKQLLSGDSMLVVVTPIIQDESTKVELNTVIEDVVRSQDERRIKILRPELNAGYCFKDGVHLSRLGNDKLVSAILRTIRFVPNSCFAKQRSMSDLSDRATKRPVSELSQKMPRFESQSQSKKFKPLLSSTRASLHSPGDLSQSQHSKLAAKPSISVSATSTPRNPTKLEQQVQSDPFLAGNAEQCKVVFDSGSPARFWLYADTVALYDLQLVIQDMLSKSLLWHGDFSLEVGSMVLARYPVDKLVYRARVEQLIQKVGETDLFSVRFIDYGTRSDGLQHGDLYAWDSILDTVPPQAAACSFFGVPVKIRDKNRFSCEEYKVFTALMKQSSPMDMKVHKIIHTVKSSDTELLVSLDSKDGDILTQLSHNETFREYFALLELPKPPDSLPVVSSNLGQPLSQTLNQQPQDNQTSLSPTVIKSEIENLKTNVETIVLRLGKDEDLVMDLDRRTEEMEGVCKSVVNMVKDGIAGFESKFADSQPQGDHLNKLASDSGPGQKDDDIKNSLCSLQ